MQLVYHFHLQQNLYKRVTLKKNTKIGFQDRLSLDAGQKY